jgi:DNA invertase Pin-like site-specific DNA recombinase
MSDRPETQPIICAGLRRVSLPGQVENYSLDAQDHEFDELEKKFNCIIPPEFRVSDEGFSGADPNRPSIRLVTKWLSEGKIQAVAYAHIDRSSRDMEDGLSRIRIYREAGGKVLFGNLGWVTDERQLKTQIQLGLMFAEMQRDDIRAKTTAGVMQKVRNGVAHGKSPWGWRTVTAAELAYEAMQQGKPAPRKPQNYRVIVPEERAAYRLMEELAVAGNGLRGICRELKLRQIKTRRGKDFNATTLGKIMADDCYWTGQWYYNKTRTVKPKVHRKRGIERHRMKSTHKSRPRSEWVGPQELPGGPITTKQRHDAVLEALKRNGMVSDGRPAAEGGYEAILKNLVKCSLCGYAVIPKQKSTPAGRRCWYGCCCRDRVTGKHLCLARSVNARSRRGHLGWHVRSPHGRSGQAYTCPPQRDHRQDRRRRIGEDARGRNAPGGQADGSHRQGTGRGRTRRETALRATHCGLQRPTEAIAAAHRFVHVRGAFHRGRHGRHQGNHSGRDAQQGPRQTPRRAAGFGPRGEVRGRIGGNRVEGTDPTRC